jgi:hypothetical protein
MVLDPHLAQHLAHWGINMMQVGGAGAQAVDLLNTLQGCSVSSAQPGTDVCTCPGALLFRCVAPQMEKTEKTMAEMEIDQNMNQEFNSITEAGSKLQPLSGPGWVAKGTWVAQARGRVELHTCSSSVLVPVCPAPYLCLQPGGPHELGQQLLHEQRPASAVGAAGDARALRRRSSCHLQVCTAGGGL